MSAVSSSVTPASSAAWIVAIASAGSGYARSLFIDIGMAPRPIADTVYGPSERCCTGVPPGPGGAAADATTGSQHRPPAAGGHPVDPTRDVSVRHRPTVLQFSVGACRRDTTVRSHRSEAPR